MRQPELPKVYPITDTKLSGLSHAEQTSRLIAGGATFIQLRDKDASPAEFYAAAADAIAMARGTRVKIIINDRVDIAFALEADGVHLGQDDLPPDEARRILGANAIIGLSTHNIQQVADATRMPVDYIAFGPVFSTNTKRAPDATVGLRALREARAIAGDRALVAIGGSSSRNVREVIAAGADSAAVISCVVANAEEITAKMAEMLNIVNK